MKEEHNQCESFIEKCKSLQEIYNKNKKTWDDINEKQQQYGVDYSPKTRFKWLKLSSVFICPCNYHTKAAELENRVLYIDNKYIYHMLVCKCGYEYAYKDYRFW